MKHVWISLILVTCFAAISFAQASSTRVQVSPGVMQGMIVKKVAPEYPQGAKNDHVEGAVELKVIVDKQGDVANIQTISGPERLVPAATDAVKQWKYKPYLLNGQPVEVETKVTVNFTLAD